MGRIEQARLYFGATAAAAAAGVKVASNSAWIAVLFVAVAAAFHRIDGWLRPGPGAQPDRGER